VFFSRKKALVPQGLIAPGDSVGRFQQEALKFPRPGGIRPWNSCDDFKLKIDSTKHMLRSSSESISRICWTNSQSHRSSRTEFFLRKCPVPSSTNVQTRCCCNRGISRWLSAAKKGLHFIRTHRDHEALEYYIHFKKIGKQPHLHQTYPVTSEAWKPSRNFYWTLTPTVEGWKKKRSEPILVPSSANVLMHHKDRLFATGDT